MRIFFTEGRHEATLEDIARAAGVNKALIHYYYRDRERLTAEIYREALQTSFLRMFDILLGEGDFESRIRHAIGHLCSGLAKYPFMEAFIVGRINAAGDRGIELSPVKEARDFVRKFKPEVERYLRKRNIRDTDADNFIIDLMALCAYPPAIMPVAKHILGYSEKKYRTFLKKRQSYLSDLILRRSA